MALPTIADITEPITEADKKTGRDHLRYSWESFPNAYLRLHWHMPYLKYSQNVHFLYISINKTFGIFLFEKHVLFTKLGVSNKLNMYQR